MQMQCIFQKFQFFYVNAVGNSVLPDSRYAIREVHPPDLRHFFLLQYKSFLLAVKPECIHVADLVVAKHAAVEFPFKPEQALSTQ